MPPSGGGSGSTTSTVTQKADPWSGIQQQLLQAVGDTQKLYNQGGSTPNVNNAGYQSALSQWQASQANNTHNGRPLLPGSTNYGAASTPMPTIDQFTTPGTPNASGSPLAPNYFPGNTVAPLAPQQQQSIDATTQRATQGSPVNQANQGMLTNTLNGNYLDPNSNPWLKGTYDQAAKSVTGTVNSAFGQGGRYGSGLNQYTLGQNLDNLANTLYGGQYQAGRNNQLQASALAPQAANQDYTDLSALSNAGATLQGQNQSNINDQFARYNYTATQPAQQIQNYMGLLNSTGVGNSSTGTSTIPNGGNALGQNLGAGLGLLGNIGGLSGGAGMLGSLFGGAGGAAGGFSSLGQGLGFLGSAAGTYGPFLAL